MTLYLQCTVLAFSFIYPLPLMLTFLAFSFNDPYLQCTEHELDTFSINYPSYRLIQTLPLPTHL